MKALNKLKFSRRHALRGMVGGIGVSLWLPVLDIMCNENGTAFGQGSPLPTTFGTFFWGNGIYPGSSWTPNGTGEGNAWQMPSSLSDFAELKGDMTLVTGIDMLSAEFKGHGWGVVYVLAGGDGTECHTIGDISRSPHGGKPETANGTQWMPTIDQLVAKAISTDEPYKSLETGILKYTGINMGTASLNLAHSGPNQPLAPERDPVKFFDKLFGTGAPPTEGTPMDVSGELRRSVLDAVLLDAKRLQMTVGAEDAKRIEAHMESVRSLEARIPDTAGGANPDPAQACVIPTKPTEQAANVDLKKVTATSQAMNKLIAAALSCNMTRVYSHLWSGARDDTHYPIINQDTEHHTLTHDGKVAEAAQIQKYIMTQYADLAKTLKATSIGDSNLLDQTIIYGISDVGEPQGHVMKNFHIVLMGHAGGKIKGDRHIRKTGSKVTQLMLSLQQVMGMEIDNFGTWDPTSTPLDDILA
jgi:Protein of unknown function (DUF1552)